MQVTGHSREAASTMQQVHQLVENADPAAGPVQGELDDNYALPMIPRDIGIPAALLRYGLWTFTQVIYLPTHTNNITLHLTYSLLTKKINIPP